MNDNGNKIDESEPQRNYEPNRQYGGITPPNPHKPEDVSKLIKRYRIGSVCCIVSFFIFGVPLSLVAGYLGYSAYKGVQDCKADTVTKRVLSTKTKLLIVFSIFSLVINIITLVLYYPEAAAQFEQMYSQSSGLIDVGAVSPVWG